MPIVTYNNFMLKEHSQSTDKHANKLTIGIFTIAFVLFVASLFLPVFLAQTHDIYGYWVLILGWMGFIVFQFAWFAAPLAILAIHLSKKSPQLAFFLSIIVIIIASEAFLFSKVPLQETQEILGYGLGFYLWYASFYIVSLGLLHKLVLWGSSTVEESDVKLATVQIAPTKTYTPPKRPKTGVTTIVIKKHKTLNLKRPSLKKKNIWKKSSPLKLPQKNIYARATPPDLPISRKPITATPPPLPVSISVTNQKVPPPLPINYKKS